MIPKNLTSITADDLDNLVRQQVGESTRIEYKREMPASTNDEKRKLLRVVCSFANTVGGDLLIGVEEDQGLPVRAPGISVADPDAESLRLQQIIQSGLEPRPSAVRIHPVPVKGGKHVFVIRTIQNWNRPLRVKQDRHFYGRTSGGTYQLDVDEIRRAFVLSESQADRIRSFVAERLLAIKSGDLPVQLKGKARLALHLVPVNAVGVGSELLTTDDLESEYPDQLQPITTGGMSRRHTLEGFSVYSPGGRDESSSVVTLFRSGAVEAVDGYMLDDGRIHGGLVERSLLQAFPRYLEILCRHEVQLPVFVFLALLGVKGFQLIGPQNDAYSRMFLHPIDRDDLLLPEGVVTAYTASAEDTLRPLFDRVWNVAGMKGSPNFDENGKWNRGQL